MKIFLFFIAIFILLISNSNSQTPSWHTLPNSPSSPYRMDDVSFINEYTGWVTYNTTFGGGNTGKIYKTSDGGTSWVMQKSVFNVYMRCIGFTDSLHGFAGTLGNLVGLSPTPIMYKTTNGGITWDSVTFANNRPSGLCGMSVLNTDYIFACGRLSGPSYFIKTTNAGINWVSQNMSSYAVQLIDCKFFSPDSGFVVGAVDTPSSMRTGVVLFTSNGGTNWIERYHGSRSYNGFWKISFPSRLVGYISINENIGTDSLFTLKTTNGGSNWIMYGCPVVSNATQGIGFINESTCWTGGASYTYKTTNGGLTWQQDIFGVYINRLRFLNDSIGYASGSRIYKFTNEPIGIQPISTKMPAQYLLYQNYPNPFNPETKIKFEIPSVGTTRRVDLTIFNALGQKITTLVNEDLKSGVYEVTWNASEYPSGVYFYKLQTENFSESKKLILIK